MTTIRKTLLAVGAAVIIGFAIYEAQQASMLRQRLASLEQQQAPLNARVGSLEQERDEATNRLASLANENSGLKKNSVELLALRGEVTRLRNDARQNPKPAPSTAVTAAPSTPPPGEAPSVPSNHVVTATATVRDGQTFAAGGWPGEAGTRTFLLTTPQVVPDSAGGANVQISAVLIDVAEAGLPESLARKSQGIPQEESTVLTAPELESLMSKLASEGTNILSRPSVIARNGQSATVSIGQLVPNPDGSYRNAGTTFQVLPEVSQDGQSIKVELNLEHSPLKAGNENGGR